MTGLQGVWIGAACLLALPAPSAVAAPAWTPAQIVQLRHWAQKTPEDALPVPDLRALESAEANMTGIDEAATELALCLARMHLLGHVPASRRGTWRIADNDTAIDLRARLEAALSGVGLEAFFRGLQPDHPEYAGLRRAYAWEADRSRRATIARNMERWRWLPRSLGHTHILVNQPQFEASLWRDGVKAGTWKVIVGKPSTPTPVFTATVQGVIVNPWWTVPASIIREMKGRFPSSRGYVRRGGQVQQRPGPNNALGVVKLDMPNPFSVYLHDTPNKSLFDRPVRAFSHGCVRVNDALDMASAILGPGTTRGALEEIVATRRTTEIALAAPVPVYIAYFTAGMDRDGKLAFYDDIYGRDSGNGPSTSETACRR